MAEKEYFEMDTLELLSVLRENKKLANFEFFEAYAENSALVYLNNQTEKGNALLVQGDSLLIFVGKAVEMAYEEHHSYGIREVFNALTEYLDLVVKYK